MKIPSPLIDYTIFIINEECHINYNKALIVKVIQDFIYQKISFLSAARIFLSELGTIKHIERLQTIMSLCNSLPPISHDLQIEFEKKKTHPWTLDEDNRLLAAIHKYGSCNWGAISQFVGNGRTKAQCCSRWCRVLDPHISKAEWTNNEDQKLLMLVAKYGNNNFSKVSYELGNRSDFQCKYRYKQLTKDPIPSLLPDSFNLAQHSNERDIHPDVPKEQTKKNETFSNN